MAAVPTTGGPGPATESAGAFDAFDPSAPAPGPIYPDPSLSLSSFFASAASFSCSITLVVWLAMELVTAPVSAPTLTTGGGFESSFASAASASVFLSRSSASSSRRFCSAPGLGRAASSMTTVNASAKASPSTRYTKGVAQLP